MTKDEVLKLSHGVYRVFWKEGGFSLASVGSLHDGSRWLAPCNWTNKDTAGICHAGKIWKSVNRVELIESK